MRASFPNRVLIGEPWKAQEGQCGRAATIAAPSPPSSGERAGVRGLANRAMTSPHPHPLSPETGGEGRKSWRAARIRGDSGTEAEPVFPAPLPIDTPVHTHILHAGTHYGCKLMINPQLLEIL